MTLAELRATVRQNIMDDGAATTFTDAQVDRCVNLAMQHVANWIISRDPPVNLLLASYSGVLANPGSARTIYVTPTGAYTRVRQIVRAERTGLSNTDDPSLKIIDAAGVESEFSDALQDKPKVFLWNQQIGFVQPLNNVAVTVWYVVGLPAMTADTDSPGVAGGVGTVNLIPLEYQGMIAAYATLLVLAGENSDSKWSDIYGELRENMAGALLASARTPEKG